MLNRLIKEVKEYTKAPVSDIKLQVNEENFTDLRAEISGPGASAFSNIAALSLLSTHLLLHDMPYLSRKLSAAVLLFLSAPLPFTSLNPDVSTEACMLRFPHAPISWPARPSLLPPSLPGTLPGDLLINCITCCLPHCPHSVQPRLRSMAAASK